MTILGIDIGGSGIKGAIVDVENGQLITDRHRIPTPQPATPKAVAKTVKELVEHFKWKGTVGCSFPSVVKEGKCFTAGNIAQEWIGTQIDDLFSKTCGGIKFVVGNDADLAGVAEMRMGAGIGLNGKVMMVTIGTGLGSGLFFNGELIPNIELGHLFHTDGRPIEKYAADSAREREGLELEEWAKRFDFFLNHLNRVTAPDHIIIGGGISKKFDKFEKYLTADIPITVAKFRNQAGIIGAAMYALDMSN
ncbi:polyphosphate--glucose phosphotransferase [Reichenbachiella versicolor]|uniref:polyphosphate--glucose phosphotransferase n=1 Tax=Reichenbachiella versicolor TaxID=1821036 RepID=UPI000D6DCFDC|nr:ROK family protein [Reichenbachiella versicolor]